MTDMLAEALHEAGLWPDYPNWADPAAKYAGRLRVALRERGVRFVTVQSLAGAAQNHETSGIHGSLHCSLACGASLFAALEEA